MAKQTIDLGVAPNTGTGEPLRIAFNKVNENFTEVYSIAQGAFDYANTIISDIEVDPLARTLANAASELAQSAFDAANNATGNITFIETTISAPDGADIIVEAKDENGIVNASLKLNPEYAVVRLDAKNSDNRQFYQGEFGDYAAGTWTTSNGSATLSLTGATLFLNFIDDDPEWREAGDRETGEFSLDGDTWYQWPYSYSLPEGGIVVTFNDESFIADDPVAVESFYLRWINNSYIAVDQEDYSEVKIVGAGVDVKIKSTNSIDVEAGDSINFEAQRSISLQTIIDPVRIETNIYGNRKTWEFDDDGNLTIPQNGDILNSDSVSVLPNSNPSFDSLSVAGNTTVQHVIPSANVTYDLGSDTARFRDLYLSGNTIYIGEVVLTTNNDVLELPQNTVIGTSTVSTFSGDYNDLINTPNQELNTNSDVTFANATFDSISHSGLVLTSGTEVDQVFITNQMLQITDDWIDTSIVSTTLPTGTYIVQIKGNDTSVGGQHVNEYYSGVMSWYSSMTDSTVFDEIVLHRAGEGPGSGVLYLRVQRETEEEGGDLKLQIAGSNNNLSEPILYVFKFRRLL
jgi:hypothetical protein